MAFYDQNSNMISCKLVYYGPGMGGKTTSLQYIYDSTLQINRGKLTSVATETDRTIFFDFSFYKWLTLNGVKVRFHLYTVPG